MKEQENGSQRLIKPLRAILSHDLKADYDHTAPRPLKMLRSTFPCMRTILLRQQRVGTAYLGTGKYKTPGCWGKQSGVLQKREECMKKRNLAN